MINTRPQAPSSVQITSSLAQLVMKVALALKKADIHNVLISVVKLINP